VVTCEPPPGDGGSGTVADGRLALQVDEVGGREPGADGVERVDELLPVAPDDLGAHDRDDAVRGLQLAIVGEQQQILVGEVRVGGVHQPDVDLAVGQRIGGHRP
jgi:hypothetical protein